MEGQDAAASAYVRRGKLAPGSPSPRFSQNDLGSVGNYGARGTMDAQQPNAKKLSMVNQQSQNRRRNWQGLHTIPEP